MSNDTKDSERKPLRLSTGNTLGLKKTVDGGQVKQSFSHGRSKTVQVEVKRKRGVEPGVAPAAPRPKVKIELTPKKASEPKSRGDGGARADTNSGLTDRERAARLRAVELAKKREEERIKQEAERAQVEAEEAARRAAEEAERAKAEAEEAARRAAEEAERVAAQAEDTADDGEPDLAPEPALDDEPAIAKPARSKPEAKAATKGTIKLKGADDEDERRGSKKGAKKADRGRGGPAVPARGGRQEGPRKAARISLQEALEGDEDRQRSLASLRRRREKEKQQAQAALAEGNKVVREVIVPDSITVQELANRMAERSGNVIKALMKMGVIATNNQSIDADTAELIVEEFGHKLRRVSEADVETDVAGVPEDDAASLKPRPPVVTIMGHVDHGKTSLLDAIRKANVVSGEAGGITQHIGAYQVKTANGEIVSFLDTPGHAAFSEMRARGANVTDIVILVVAADDSIMPQTVEAINHAKAAKVPIIVAVNKIDKPGADPQKVKTDLLQHELQVEDLGGEVQCVEVSALKKIGLNELLEQITLQAELLELKANPDRSANGSVVEARLDKGRGSVATVLVEGGTLQRGDIVVAGTTWGKVRALINDQGKPIKSAGPAMPAEILGLNGVPVAGDNLVVVESEARARELTAFRQAQQKEAEQRARRGTLEQMFSNIQSGGVQELPILIKTDVHGSAEAIVGALEKLSTEEVKVQILHSAVGGITESDITLAKASNAVIFGFNVRANPQARAASEREGIDIRYYSIIYELIDDVKALLSGLLKPEQREKFLGYAEIREVFNVTKVGKVAGCYVTDGEVQRGAKVRLLRDNVVIHNGTLKTLRRFKDEVKEVQNGYECGMAFENYSDIQVGDQIECYLIEEIQRQL
jgi:translation initiation factor IF-2